MSIGSRLVEERERLGLSQAAFFRACGASKAAQYNFERDINVPGGTYLIEAAALGVDVNYVLTGRRVSDVPGASETMAAYDMATTWIKQAGLPEDDPLFHPFAGVMTAVRNDANIDTAVASLLQAYARLRPESEVLPLDTSLLGDCIAAVETHLKNTRRRLAVEPRAELIATVYEEFRERGSATRAKVLEFVRRAA